MFVSFQRIGWPCGFRRNLNKAINMYSSCLVLEVPETDPSCVPQWEITVGYRVVGSTVRTMTVPPTASANIGRCLDVCLRTSGCASVNYRNVTGTCQLQSDSKTQATRTGNLQQNNAYVNMDLICTGKSKTNHLTSQNAILN